MASVNRDNCIVCSKVVRKFHKDISCKICHGFIHKKCTNLKLKQLKCLNSKNWVCQNCCQEGHSYSNSDLENDIDSLNECSDFDITKADTILNIQIDLEEKRGGVCMFISEELKYKLRTDLCQANSNYESCFIEIENKNKNVIVGVVYRAQTSIDGFISDIEPICRKIN